MLQKQPVLLTFSGAEQRTGKKHLPPGRLVLAENVYQAKTKAYRKRFGFSRMANTTDSGTIANTRALGSLDGAPVLQTNDSVYQYSSGQSKWINRGSYAPVSTSIKTVFPAFGSRPMMTTAGGYTWYCAFDNYYCYYKVTDSTGVEVVPTTKIATSGQVFDGRVIVVGDYVWVFLMSTDFKTIRNARFTIATPTTAPTINDAFFVAANSPAGGGWDAILANTGTQDTVYVAMWSSGTTYVHTTGGNYDFVSMYLDGSTGNVAMIPGVVGDTSLNASTGNDPGMLLPDVGGKHQLITLLDNGATKTWTLWEIDATTLALGAPSSWATASADTLRLTGAVTTARQIYYADISTPETAITYTARGVTAYAVSYGTFPVTAPFQVGSAWYIILGHDDGAAVNLQRAYYLCKLSGTNLETRTIVARALYGLGGDAKQTTPQNAYLTFWDYTGKSPVVVSGNTVKVLVNSCQGGAAFATAEITFDASPTMGAYAYSGSSAMVLPGSWPHMVASGQVAQEAAPPMYPASVSLSPIATGTPYIADGTYSVCALYAVSDSAGNVYRSAPSAIATQAIAALTNNGIAVTVPTLRLVNSSAKVWVEVYISRPNGTDTFLAARAANDSAATTVTVNLYSYALSNTGEILYTAGRELPNDPLPSFRSAANWRDRIFLFDTEQRGEVWYSKPITTGTGASFSAYLRLEIREAGRIYGGAGIDYNSLAIFGDNGVWWVSGDGPDNTGAGNYVPMRIDGAIGCSKPNSIVTTPAGCMYRGDDGCLYLIRPDRSVSFVGRGIEDATVSYEVNAAISVPQRDWAMAFLSSGRVMVYDYGNPTQDDQEGQWYQWTGLAGSAATVIAGVPYFADSSGYVWYANSAVFTDNGTAYNRKMTTGAISFAGLQGFERIYNMKLMGDFVASHTVKVTVSYDNGAASQNLSKTVTAGPEWFEFRPNRQKCSMIEVTIEDTGTPSTDTGTLEAIAFEVGMKGRTARLGTGQRF